MTDLFVQIEDRAVSTPRMTAVRLDGEAVTFDALHQKITEYGPVVAAQGLSRGAALAAALMSLLPQRVRELSPVEQGEWVAAATQWLGRGLADVGSPLGEAV
ncbi:hypothetical protein GOHSU_06_00550 [Gordonia hirsuta DSM 44140 = NBRC 16056]|uniref:Uncharacterized protein n=1 Tax=Gordonia hirsuta DSM 44140 = NBRC 16056 TaxID=1121927 RepID=L7L8U0_9ACTN|nr:hypothetical protein [Gordonia hirsuta]GAC56443.1 hypothetical protein GOHSU_06_00550 [Gordonia hirsuta DSM 44140 = NBRC 16056]